MALKLVVYIPESHREPVKDALFAAGAGRLGKYDQCCWQTRGYGQFRPLVGSDPHIGTAGSLEQVDEWRVEMLVADELAANVRDALLHAHPYEEPAYEFVPLMDI